MRSIPGIALLVLALLVAASCCTAPAGNGAPASPAPSPGTPVGLPATPVPDTGGIPAGSWQYIFSDPRGNADRPITVYTYRPASWNLSGPVLVAMHGAGRDGGPARNTWIPYADQYSCLVVAPEFSTAYYPGDSWYIGGNVFDDTMNWQPKQNWTYTAVEHLFDDVRNRTGAQQETYLLYGHSAGAQFVHRMVTFLPEARFSRAVAANAGVYAMPSYTIGYGFGLNGSPLREVDLPKVFARKLIIMSGDRDTVRDGSLATFPAADAQGSNRFERAKKYYETAEAEAAARGVPLNWEYHVVPGVGHDDGGMAKPSADLLFAP